MQSHSEQPDLIPRLRRELVLEIDDPAISDDPLEAFLQRRGWCLKRAERLQASIARKLTPSLLTGKTDLLSRSELELQSDIDKYIAQVRKERRRTLSAH